jgi:DNA helicase II / ATP-dependent DNA helicase PcrA
VPIAYASSTGAVAEERRLLYVALSRAQRELRCSWARERKTANGASLRREPSPWLGALASHCGIGSETPQHADTGPISAGHGTTRDRTVTRWTTNSRAAHPAAKQPVADLDGEVPETTVLRSLASARRRLAGTHLRGHRTDPAHDDPAVTAVAGRLRDWRRRLARASGVPPHVLLHDSTVIAIAIRRPANTDELLAVPGIGPVKVARFGPGILKAVHEDDVPVALAAADS